jgi:hypothetical protein
MSGSQHQHDPVHIMPCIVVIGPLVIAVIPRVLQEAGVSVCIPMYSSRRGDDIWIRHVKAIRKVVIRINVKVARWQA